MIRLICKYFKGTLLSCYVREVKVLQECWLPEGLGKLEDVNEQGIRISGDEVNALISGILLPVTFVCL